jgi:hypothetical protein
MWKTYNSNSLATAGCSLIASSIELCLGLRPQPQYTTGNPIIATSSRNAPSPVQNFQQNGEISVYSAGGPPKCTQLQARELQTHYLILFTFHPSKPLEYPVVAV